MWINSPELLIKRSVLLAVAPILKPLNFFPHSAPPFWMAQGASAGL